MLNTLVVDDSELIRNRLEGMLRAIPGMEDVRTAANLSQALDAVYENPPSMLFLDLHLPDGNALLILRVLKRMAPEMQIVMLTNDATDFNRRKCMEEGADAFFDKSTELEGALAWVQLVMTARSLAPAADQPGCNT